MKQIKFLRSAASIFAVVFFTCIALFSKAQFIVPATLPDNLVGPVGYPNSSTIDYSNFFPSPTPQFTAMVADGGPAGPPPTLFVNDLALPGAWAAVPLPAPAGCSPDVIVGNDPTIPGDLLIAVVATVPCPGGADVNLFMYREPGPAPYGAPPILIGVFNLSGTCNVAGPAHIDIINEYSTPIGAPALPQANKFAVTWKDNTPGLGIMGYFANLNAPFPGLAVSINANPNLTSPDVAAVERLGFGFEDWAMFTYVDQTVTPNVLYRQDWRMAPFLPPAPLVVYDATVNYLNWAGFISTVRIDAIDDFAQNVPGGGNATFDVVASVPLMGPPGGAAVYQYNDVIGPFPPPALADITTPVPGLAGNKNVVPQVTCGSGQFYSIAYHRYGPFGQNYYAQAVDWPTGTTTTTNNAYLVNLNAYGPSPGWPFGICVSATHNTNLCGIQQLFVGWENVGSLWNKYNASPCAPFAFKQSPGQVAAVNTNTEWLLTPNPASDHVQLTAPAGYKAEDGAAYSITDLSGKVLLQGSVTATEQQIGVTDLPAGMYMLHLQSKATNTKTIKFVKE